MDNLFSTSDRLIRSTDMRFQRSLVDRIDWSQRLIEIRGSRGVGKTTLMLQRAGMLQRQGLKVLYASLDTPYFFNNSIVDLAEYLNNYGITHLFLDEVNRYPSKHIQSDWSLEIKNVYDTFPDLKVVYSGSSILQLYKGKGDLSRRKAGYLMPGLSFREYLALQGIADLDPVGLPRILADHVDLAHSVIRHIKPIPHFRDYLTHGYYPFFSGDIGVYQSRIRDVVNLIIDTDLPYVASVSPNAREQLKRMLGAISTTVPYVPNLSRLAEMMHIKDHRTLLKYLHLLEEAALVTLLRSDAKGNKILRKPDKIYLNNTNLSRALGLSESDAGTERETFFLSQASVAGQVRYPKEGDFLVDNEIVFEIGGKRKSGRQLRGDRQACIAADDIETGFASKIPLWLFGFLY